MASWNAVAHFDVETKIIWGVFILLPAPIGLWLFYSKIRPDRKVASAMFGITYLALSGPAISVFSYFFLSLTRSPADVVFARIDQTIGFDWPSVMIFVAGHPTFSSILGTVYSVSIWQIFTVIFALGWLGDDREEVEEMCLAITLCGIATILIWAAIPSIGAAAVYHLPSNVEAAIRAPVDGKYARETMGLFGASHVRIHSGELRGLVGFPSFHAQEAVVATWFLRSRWYLLVPAVAFNTLTIISCPIEGGHHLVDVLAGIAVAAAAIWFSAVLFTRVTITAPKGSSGTIPALFP